MHAYLKPEADDRTLEYYKEFKNQLITFLSEELNITPAHASSKSQSLFKSGILASAACAGYDTGLSPDKTIALMISIEGLCQRREAQKNLSEWFFSNQKRENRQAMERLLTASIAIIENLSADRKDRFEHRFSEIQATFS